MKSKGLVFILLFVVFYSVSGCKKEIKVTYSFSGSTISYDRENNGVVDSAIYISDIDVTETSDSIFFESSINSFNDRFRKNKENVYNYGPLGSHTSKTYKLLTDSLYASYGYSNPTTVMSWGNFFRN